MSLDAEDILDRLEVLAMLVITGLGMARAWAEYKKARCETCAAHIALIQAASAEEEGSCDED